MKCRGLFRGERPRVAPPHLDSKVFLMALLVAAGASAQAGPGSLASPPPQFDVTGFIQAATTDGAAARRLPTRSSGAAR